MTVILSVAITIYLGVALIHAVFLFGTFGQYAPKKLVLFILSISIGWIVVWWVIIRHCTNKINEEDQNDPV